MNTARKQDILHHIQILDELEILKHHANVSQSKKASFRIIERMNRSVCDRDAA